MFFGIIALLLTGGSWCLIGAVMGQAPRHRLDAATVQLCGACTTILISTILLLLQHPSFPASGVLLAAGSCYLGSGILNCLMLQLMSYSMQYGPNGIIWSIIQSALIFSFLGGVVFFDVELTGFRGAGIILLSLALLLFGLCKDNSLKSGCSRAWKPAAFGALLLASLQQNISAAPSYFPEAREISSILRTLLTASGTLLSAFCWQMISRRSEFFRQLGLQLKNPFLWRYILGLQAFSLFFSYLCLYPGMDAMARHGAGAVSYPLMVGSCIVSFTLFSRFYLKEPMPPKQAAALLICVAGLIFICL